MVYSNRFTDGHSHNQSGKSPKGFPQCTKCGRVFPNMSTLRSMKGKSTSKPAKKAKQRKQSTPKPQRQVQPKVVVNIPTEEFGTSQPNQLMGEAFRIVEKWNRYEATNALDGYLKNRRKKNA